MLPVSRPQPSRPLLRRASTAIRPAADRARVLLIPNGSGGYRVTVGLGQNGGAITNVLNNLNFPYTAPANLRMGFGGSTGGLNNIHEARGVVTSTPANIVVTKTAASATNYLRGLPMTQDPKLNSHSKLNCILACIAAQKAGADEALMLDVHGFVNTTNACNFFIVRKGEVWTSTGDYCLGGITRGNVIKICREQGIPVFEKNFSLTEVYSAEEAFVTGTFAGVCPVHTIDGRKISESRGPMVERLQSHAITTLPVIDQAGRFIGVIRQAELLEQAGQAVSWFFHEGAPFVGD